MGGKLLTPKMWSADHYRPDDQFDPPARSSSSTVTRCVKASTLIATSRAGHHHRLGNSLISARPSILPSSSITTCSDYSVPRNNAEISVAARHLGRHSGLGFRETRLRKRREQTVELNQDAPSLVTNAGVTLIQAGSSAGFAKQEIRVELGSFRKKSLRHRVRCPPKRLRLNLFY